MKNSKIIESWAKIKPDKAADERMLASIIQIARTMSMNKRKMALSQPVLRYATAALAAIAVVCLAVIGYARLFPAQPQPTVQETPAATISETQSPDTQQHVIPDGIVQESNTFTFLAYAASLPDTGSGELNEFDLENKPANVFATYDEERKLFIVGLGLSCEGLNIRNIEVSVSNGFFAKLKPILVRSGEEPVIIGMNRLSDFENFDIVGNNIVFGKDTVDIINDEMLFWMVEGNDISRLPKELEVLAKVTFNDGTMQESISLVDLTDVIYIIDWTKAEYELIRVSFEKTMDYYLNIPLDECELVPESVKIVVDVYVYDIGPESFETNIFPITSAFEITDTGVRRTGQGEIEFDEDGVYRMAFGDDAGDGDERGFLVVIKRGGDGTMTGMVYRTPQRAQ